MIIYQEFFLYRLAVQESHNLKNLERINTKFTQAATYGETLTIATHVEEWRNKVVVQIHRVTRARADGGEDLICEGREVRAFVKRDEHDPDRLRAIPVPEDIRLLCS